MPAEMTGVAPWAANKRNKPDSNPAVAAAETPGAGGSTGYELLAGYMDQCAPVSTGEAPAASWLEDQAAATPTLLPSLRFHDLVFGRELGRGSFSVVRYCRRILRVS